MVCTNHEKYPICTQLAQSVLAIATTWGRFPFRGIPTCHVHELKIDFRAKEWRTTMAVNYKKLFHLMIEKELSNAELQRKAGFSGNILTRLKRNNCVSLESIERICRILDCSVDDILEFEPEGETK